MGRKPRSVDRAGLAAARKETKMTKQQWQNLQRGMKEKWPQPHYMKVPHPEGKSHTSYRDETFELVTRFMAETRISYRPHAIAPGSKSHVRYEKYSQAKTVAQALKRGSWPVDWCWDIERGYIKVAGPLREEPLDASQLPEDYKFTDVDKAVIQWYRRELAKKYGLDLKDLVVERGGNESIIMRAHRLVSLRESNRILAECSKGKRMVSDDDVALVLGNWGFARNAARTNVMQNGVKWVWSDTMGLLRDRCGDIHLTQSTHGYPQVVEVLSRWLTDRLPNEAQNFKWTSLNLNKNYAAKIHRDGNNFGPSMIAAFGDFQGGNLNYYPHDDGKIELQELESKQAGQACQLNLKSGLALFNGNSAHSVDDFEGNRFSIVYFTLGCHSQMKQADKDKLQSMGISVPSPDEDPFKLIRAPHSKASGKYRGVATPARQGRADRELPAWRYWPKVSLTSGSSRKRRRG